MNNRLQPHATWLYGVVVALAIREGLIAVVPQITSSDHSLAMWVLMLRCWRLTVFLITLIRFFLGSVCYFESVYRDDVPSNAYPHKNFGLDFLIGLIHFVLFFAWATTIADVFHHESSGLSHFETTGCLILLYDCVWLLVNCKSDTKTAILPWTVINFITVLLCVGAIFLPYPSDFIFKEQVAILIVVIVGLIDIAGMISNRSLIAETMLSIFSTGAPSRLYAPESATTPVAPAPTQETE